MDSQILGEQPRNICLTHRCIIVWYFTNDSWAGPTYYTGVSFLINHEVFLCGTGKSWLSTTLRKIWELGGKKPYEVAWSCQLQHSRQRRRLFLLEGNKVQILSLQAFSWPLFQLSLLLHSSLSNCICQHCRENSATCWWLSKLGFALWILMFWRALSWQPGKSLPFRMTFYSVYCD